MCLNQSNILYAVNRRIGEYKKYMLEAENAASGRALLAGQAQGVSEILRNLALEQSEPLQVYTQREHALNTALLSAGVVCSEVLIYGEESNPTLSLITFGKSDVKKIAAVASEQFHAPMIISERLTLSNDKFCCILRKKPCFDAAFGVATAKNQANRQAATPIPSLKSTNAVFLSRSPTVWAAANTHGAFPKARFPCLKAFTELKCHPKPCFPQSINYSLLVRKKPLRA
jgi:hypothetical protein